MIAFIAFALTFTLVASHTWHCLDILFGDDE